MYSKMTHKKENKITDHPYSFLFQRCGKTLPHQTPQSIRGKIKVFW